MQPPSAWLSHRCMLDLRFGLSCPDVHLGHVKNLSREEMYFVTSFTLFFFLFVSSYPPCFPPTFLVCVGGRGAHLSHSVRARGSGRPFAACLGCQSWCLRGAAPRGEHGPGVPPCPSAVRPGRVLPCKPVSTWLSRLCYVLCSVSEPR